MKNLNKITILSIIIAIVVAITGFILITTDSNNKEFSDKFVNWQKDENYKYSYKNLVYENEDVSLSALVENDIEDLFVDVTIDNSKNLLRQKTLLMPDGVTYYSLPFMLDGTELTNVIIDYENQVVRANANHRDTNAPYTSRGRLIIPSIDLSIPAVNEGHNTFLCGYILPKYDNAVEYNDHAVNSTYEVEEVFGHSTYYGMGRIAHLEKDGVVYRKGVELGDLAYYFLADGSTKIYKAVTIEPHANQRSNGGIFDIGDMHVDSFGGSVFWDSNGNRFFEKYDQLGDVDILYTDCCNNILMEDDYDYNEDPGNYAIIWEKIS